VIALNRPAVLLACWIAACAAAAQDPSPVCSSDGQAAPAALLERFVNADCAGCWTDLETPKPGPGQVALDWILPGSRDDDAPLAAAARREGLDRLAALGRAVPRNDDSRVARRAGGAVSLRVAHGLAFNGYIGASIELRNAPKDRWHAWLALVETLPVGTEGSPVERNLVRNVLELHWDPRRHPAQRLAETRPMNIPAGADARRLRVIGFVEDVRGRIKGIAQTRCAPARRKG
jgi:hypothetical protein